jgi:hypothetical protein
MWGQEFVGGSTLLNTITYPQRFIRSFALLYGLKPDESVRIGFGLSLTRGNALGEFIAGSTFRGKRVEWYDDIAYRAVGVPYDVTFSPLQKKYFSLDLFFRGEVNPKRLYGVIGFGLSIYMNGN